MFDKLPKEISKFSASFYGQKPKHCLVKEMAETAQTVTVRLIRSFEYRNIHNKIYRDVDLKQSASCFLAKVKEGKISL